MSDVEVEQKTQTAAWTSPIADPMMNGKLMDRTLKLVKKAVGEKCVRRGVPECTKAIRKGQQGIVLLAGDVFPIDILAHLPAFCEEKDIVYAYVESRTVLGEACGSTRAASAVMIMEPKADSGYTKAYEQVVEG